MGWSRGNILQSAKRNCNCCSSWSNVALRLSSTRSSRRVSNSWGRCALVTPWDKKLSIYTKWNKILVEGGGTILEKRSIAKAAVELKSGVNPRDCSWGWYVDGKVYPMRYRKRTETAWMGRCRRGAESVGGSFDQIHINNTPPPYIPEKIFILILLSISSARCLRVPFILSKREVICSSAHFLWYCHTIIFI